MDHSPAKRLLLFGGASLEDQSGPIVGRGAQRRRVALMAILAVHRRAISRDKLIGYLWEEADTDKARRLLSEAVYVIRRSLGEDSILAVGDDLRLNPDVVWSDVPAFADALQDGRVEQAVALYNGPLMDGFFISEAGEFDQWLDRERDRLAREYSALLTRLAQRAEQQGDYSGAVSWWRRLCAHDPFGSVPALSLMRALDAAGDRVGALQHARVHAARLSDELSAEPDAQIEAFAQELRAAPALPAPVRVPAQPAAPPATRELQPSGPTEIDAAGLLQPGVTAPLPPAVRKRYTRASAALALLLLASIVGALIYSARDGDRRAVASKGSAVTIAILPFDAPPAVAWLSKGVPQLISMHLDGAGDLHAVDPHVLLQRAQARATGEWTPAKAATLVASFNAQLFVLGAIVPSGQRFSIVARVYSRERADAIGTAMESGVQDSLPDMLHRLSRQILASSGRLSSELRGVAASTTMHYEALKSFIQGDDLFMAGHYDSAAVAFERAVRIDSNFALAYYRLSAAAEWSFDFVHALDHARTAQHLSSRLPVKQQLLITPWMNFLTGGYGNAIQQYTEAVDKDLHNVEARYGLAEVLIHFNPLRGAPVDSAGPHFERVLKDLPEYGEARFHVLELAARANDRARFDSESARLHATNPQRPAWDAVRAFRWGTPLDQQRALSALDRADEVAIGIAAGRVAAHTHEFAGARRIAGKLARAGSTREWQAAEAVLTAQLDLAAGDWPAAQKKLRDAQTLEPDWTRQLHALYLLHPLVNTPSDSLRATRQRLVDWRPQDYNASASFFFGAHALVRPELRLYLLGMLSVALGDTLQAKSYQSALIGPPEGGIRANDVAEFARALGESLRGHLALARGQDTTALRILTGAEVTARPEYLALSPFYARAHDRFTMASLNQKLGRNAEAIRWYRSLLEGFDFVYAAPAHSRLAALYEQAGDSTAAGHHRAEFARLTRRQIVSATRPSARAPGLSGWHAGLAPTQPVRRPPPAAVARP